MSKNVTSKLLKNIILQELSNLHEAELSGEVEDIEKVAKSTEEVEASELASALEQQVDFMKALNIKEAKLVKKLRQINEAKNKLRSKILKNIDKG